MNRELTAGKADSARSLQRAIAAFMTPRAQQKEDRGLGAGARRQQLGKRAGN